MRPKLRPVDMQWIQHNGQPALLLRDPLGLSDRMVVVPRSLALLVGLCDGTRDIAGLRIAFELRTGLRLDTGTLERLIEQLDEALLLEGPRADERQAKALEEFRSLPFRPPALAGQGYPADPEELARTLESYGGYIEPGDAQSSTPPVRGLICPHIDFSRGGRTYAQVWAKAREAVREAELVILLGTDHAGSPGRMTLTRQNYATPFGVLPTARDIVDSIAAAVGEEASFAEELHHRREHSIELAAVWLHYTRGREPCHLVPILCGSFQPFTTGEAHPRQDSGMEAALRVLREVLEGRRALVVAAADLAHVGPAFGDSLPIGLVERASLAGNDARLLSLAASADADGFLAEVRREGDRRRICGLPPIYLALRLLEGARGEAMGYAQCPADTSGTSFVSIAGVILR